MCYLPQEHTSQALLTSCGTSTVTCPKPECDLHHQRILPPPPRARFDKTSKRKAFNDSHTKCNRVSCKNDCAVLTLAFPLATLAPPRKTIHNLPKTPPHQDFPSPMWCPGDRSHQQPPSTNQQCGPHRGFLSGANKKPSVNVIKNTYLKPSSHGNNDRDTTHSRM